MRPMISSRGTARILKTDDYHHPARNNWDCGTHAYTEWKVWINGEVIIDEVGTGSACFEDEDHAIESAISCWKAMQEGGDAE